MEVTTSHFEKSIRKISPVSLIPTEAKAEWRNLRHPLLRDPIRSPTVTARPFRRDHFWRVSNQDLSTSLSGPLSPMCGSLLRHHPQQNLSQFRLLRVRILLGLSQKLLRHHIIERTRELISLRKRAIGDQSEPAKSSNSRSSPATRRCSRTRRIANDQPPWT